MMKLIVLLVLVSTIHCSFVKEVISYIQMNPTDEEFDDSHEDYSDILGAIDITTPPPC